MMLLSVWAARLVFDTRCGAVIFLVVHTCMLLVATTQLFSFFSRRVKEAGARSCPPTAIFT
jgi:hypothetical protein